MVAPTIQNPTCQRQLTQASKEVARAVENVVHITQDSVNDDQLISELKSAAAAVAHALNDLLNHVRTVGDHKKVERRVVVVEQEPVAAVDTIYHATDRLFSSQGDAGEMVKQAKILAKATVQLINDLKGQAETQPDSDVQRRLIVAARLLADATARLVDAAKGCKSNPNDSDYQTALTKAAEDLRVATNTAAGNSQSKTVSRIETSEVIIEPPHISNVSHEVESYKRVQQLQKQMQQKESLHTISESHLEVRDFNCATQPHFAYPSINFRFIL